MPFNNPIPGHNSNQPGDRKPSTGLAALVQAEKLVQVAILLPSSAFIGWLFGAWADRRFHQDWISLVGVAFGGIAGLVYVVRLAITAMADSGPNSGEGKNDPRP